MADSKPKARKYNPTRRLGVWRQVDTSAPIPIEGEIWFVRTLYHTVEDRVYHDVRKWKDVPSEFAYGYTTTEEGLTLTRDDWSLLLPQLFRQFKLFEKHSSKEKKRK